MTTIQRIRSKENIASHYFRSAMANDNNRTVFLGILAIVLVAGAIYLIDPTMFGLMNYVKSEGFEGTMGGDQNYVASPGQEDTPGAQQKKATESNSNSAGGDASMAAGFKDMSGNNVAAFVNKEEGEEEGFANMQDITGPAAFEGAQAPAGCYPRDQLTPSELLPKDASSVWAQQNPMGTGSLKGKNFLSAGALIGVNTVGQSLRNANYQLRSEPANPQVPVSVFNNSTIEPDMNRRDLEIS